MNRPAVPRNDPRSSTQSARCSKLVSGRRSNSSSTGCGSGSGWAFVQLNPQRPGGAAIDLYQTTFANQADYMDGAMTIALLRYQYNRWNLVDFAVGPTDVFWQGDPLYAQLPAGLTPY